MRLALGGLTWRIALRLTLGLALTVALPGVSARATRSTMTGGRSAVIRNTGYCAGYLHIGKLGTGSIRTAGIKSVLVCSAASAA